ncbi:MAG: tRNA pseudouridine(13) synthase TruD [Phycisphaeraceae bacterium]
MPASPQSLAYLTADIPGTGGIIKERPEDFLVEEQPLYQPEGHGEHLYLYIEKRERATTDVVHRLAKLFNVRRGDIGYAGLKDKHAVTRQHLSIYKPDPTGDDKALANIEHTGMKLLWSARHVNKLRRGHHAGNRFVIRIRQVDPTAVLHAKHVLDRLEQHGVPNFIGEQRFGYRQNNHVLGRLLLAQEWQAFIEELVGNPRSSDAPPMQAARAAVMNGDLTAALATWPRYLHDERRVLDLLRQKRTPQQAVMALDSRQREFLINAWQAAIFNEVLGRRLGDGLLDKLVAGDLAWKHDSRAVFNVDETTATAENAADGRVARREVSPSGPMWGPSMTTAGGQVAQWEAAALAAHGGEQISLDQVGQAVAGSRRPMREMLRDPDISGGVDEHGAYIRVAFELPRGSYATIVLREIIKPGLTGTALAEEGEES